MQKLLGCGIKECDPISIPYLGNQALKKNNNLKKTSLVNREGLALGASERNKTCTSQFFFLLASILGDLIALSSAGLADIQGSIWSDCLCADIGNLAKWLHQVATH